MKKALISVVTIILAFCLFTTGASALTFNDVGESHWAASYIDWATNQGYFAGTSATTFSPSGKANRSMLVTVLWRYNGASTPSAQTPFTDLKEAWYQDAVRWAYHNGIVSGISPTQFSPNQAATRQQFATILFAYAKHLNIDTSASADLSAFPDRGSVATWAKQAMGWAVGIGALSGSKEGNQLFLRPTKDITRAELATMLKSFDHFLAGETKYTENNPLIAETKKPNGNVAPSYDIDNTGFVKNNIGLKDLKGKSLTLLTAVMYDTFQYVDANGKLQGEWEWFEMLREKYGLKIKYIKSRFDNSMNQALTFMNAGKQLDVIPTHVGAFPTCLNLSQPLDPYINIQNAKCSPGIDEMVLEETKWANKYRCIAPIGAVNVLWYNQSLCEQLGLQDPHTLWQQGKWNWNTWKSWLQSIPSTTAAGKALCSYNTCDADIWYAFGLTNGYNPVAIDHSSNEARLINNFGKQEVLDAWEFCCDTLAGVNNVDMKGASWSSMYSEGNVMMHDTNNLMNEFAYDENFKYCHDKQFNWVPYPNSGTKTGRDVAFCYGYTMMLPKKMKNPSNAPYAVKFMELWANRFAEAIFDYQATISYLKFDHKARMEYFNFVAKNTYFGLQMENWIRLSDADKSAMLKWWSIFGSKDGDILTESAKVKPLVDKAIDGILKYGL